MDKRAGMDNDCSNVRGCNGSNPDLGPFLIIPLFLLYGYGMRNTFTIFINKTAEIARSYWAILIAVATVIIFGVAGFVFHNHSSLHLALNGIVILTFLLTIIIQLTHKRNTTTLYRKLDELSFAIRRLRYERYKHMRHKHLKHTVQMEEEAQEERRITKQNGGNTGEIQAKIISFTPNKKSTSRH